MIDGIGRCPICQETLQQKDDFALCPTEHYQISLALWDSIWLGFDVKTDDAEELLSKLVNHNMIKDEHGNTIQPNIDSDSG